MAKIIVVGSINVDLVAKLARLPKIGETISSLDFYTGCGGKGANQAIACSKLGGNVYMVGGVGRDGYADTLKNNLDFFGVKTDFVEAFDGSSGIAMINVVKGDNCIVIAPNCNALITRELIDRALDLGEPNDILLTQFEIPLDMVEYALIKAKLKGMTTVLNPAPAVKNVSRKLLENVDIITPNESEAEILTGIKVSDDAHIALIVKQFYTYGIKHVIITLGGDGSVVSNGYEITPIDICEASVVDTTAAGDTFVGSVCVSLLAGMDIVSACRRANVASSITVSRQGASVSIPTCKEVDDKISGLLVK